METSSSQLEKSGSSDQFRADHRKQVREWELDQVLPFFPPGSSILEVGAGAGWQARRLADRGFKVTAIDIPQSRYNTMQEWPVIDYDGHHIPLPDKSVDVIFSSNVLEHIPHIEEFMAEMRRVLRPGGVAVHVMPTTLWRAITTTTFYIQRFKHLINRLTGRKPSSSGLESAEENSAIQGSQDNERQRSGLIGKLRRAALPTLHGVRGNVLSEHYYFSHSFWQKTFTAGGWQVASTQGAGMIYSGYRVFAYAIPFSVRRALAAVFGSSCRIYIAYPAKA